MYTCTTNVIIIHEVCEFTLTLQCLVYSVLILNLSYILWTVAN